MDMHRSFERSISHVNRELSVSEICKEKFCENNVSCQSHVHAQQSSPKDVVELVHGNIRGIANKLKVDLMPNVSGDLPDVLIGATELADLIKYLTLKVLVATEAHSQIYFSAEVFLDNVWFVIRNSRALNSAMTSDDLCEDCYRYISDEDLAGIVSVLMSNGGRLHVIRICSSGCTVVFALPIAANV